MSHKDKESGAFVGHFHCIANEIDGKDPCGSSDALAVHEHEDESGIHYDAYCWSCNQWFGKDHIAGSSLAEQLGIEGGVVTERKFVAKPRPEPITREEAKAFIAATGYVANGYRAIKDEYNKFYGHLTQLDSQGRVIARFYPETENGKIVGYKSRIHPKKFGYANRGRTGIKSDLSGQVKFNSGGKYVVLCAGEEDKVAAYQMFRESQIERGQGDYDSIAVVSPTTGESSAAKQCAAQYEWFDTFETIVIMMDNDVVGREAAKSIAAVLPSSKVKICTLSGKDANQMLQDGKQRQFLRDFWNAKDYVDTGIKSSNEILDDVKEVLTAEVISLPPYMHRMQTMMKRAFSKNGRIINILGSTSCGKSTHVNNMIYHWCFSEGLKPLIISLEMTAGEYAVDLLSLHLQKNLDWFKDGMDAWEYLQRQDVKDAYDNLFVDENFQERFRIVDDRDGTVESLKKLIERGVKQYGCNIVIIDVLTDILRFLPMDEQEKFMAWQKNFVKQGTSLVNVLHTKKPNRDKDGKLQKTTEFDALGSGTFVQSAHINIVINRDKMAEDPVERNTTYVDMPKCRRGTTGEAGKWYYDPETRQVHDYDDYFNGGGTTKEYSETESVVDFETGEIIDPEF